MTKRLLFFIFGLYPLILNAQVGISSQLPLAGLVSKDFLWNLVLTNNKDEAAVISIGINVKDPSSGEILMSATSKSFTLEKGVKITSVRDMQPVQYNYNVPEFNRTYLPIGSYIICYRVYRNGEEVYGEECNKINIDPLSPPLLNTPLDKSNVETPYPQFTWMPPGAIDMFNNLSYDLLVAEILEGQSSTEAIQYNSPVYSRTNLKQPVENYASSYTSLKQDKVYAWQVVARNGLNYAAKTEVWTFSIKKDSISELISMAPYIKLNKKNTEISVAQQGFLKMEIRNSITDSVGYFTVRNLTVKNEKQPEVLFSFNLPIQRGDNFLQYDMNGQRKLNKDNVYEVEYKNSLGESWFMRFYPMYYR